ncbi:MAG: hypothetical protein EOO90_23135 [Pedobacter sp.]|nr:MAG: hypothetical protein EOO90_23135 [Pedobacter sp.]
MKAPIVLFTIIVIFASCQRCDRSELCREYQPTNKAIYLDSVYKLEEISSFAMPKEGEVLTFYKNGNLSSKGNFFRGMLEGPAYYYSSGYIEQFRYFKRDRKIGLGTDFYDSTGVVKATMRYSDSGCLIWRKTYSQDGELIKIEGNINDSLIDKNI